MVDQRDDSAELIGFIRIVIVHEHPSFRFGIVINDSLNPVPLGVMRVWFWRVATYGMFAVGKLYIIVDRIDGRSLPHDLGSFERKVFFRKIRVRLDIGSSSPSGIFLDDRSRILWFNG